MRKKINITLDEELLVQLQKEAKLKNLNLSRTIEERLKGKSMNITIGDSLLTQLENESLAKKLSLSKLIEGKLKRIE